MSEKKDHGKKSHIESATTNTTGKKRKRAAGNVAVHIVKITE